ncbi:MAG TPA: hypothetical protein VK421_07805 [Pyrinomonadaceae bacterium]|nr:hypothetical protein [Pyrinomonadaceae bacterium]
MARDETTGRGAPREGRAPTVAALAESIKAELGDEWLPLLYRERVKPLRTRAFRLPAAAKNSADVEVQHTLLGVELRVGRRRVSCPDLATARYLAVFARAGCAEVAVPYDITKVSRLADELERAWQRTMLLAEHLAAGRPQAFRTRLKKFIVGLAREGVLAEGAGAAVPAFNQNTRQRRRAGS